jgi:hypothetical protein
MRRRKALNVREMFHVKHWRPRAAANEKGRRETSQRPVMTCR